MLSISRPAALALTLILLPWACMRAGDTRGVASGEHKASLLTSFLGKHTTRQGMVFEFIYGKSTKQGWKAPSE